MPACIVHNLFAKEVLSAFPETPKVEELPYIWGAQGPDIFFCHRYLSPRKERSLSNYGHLIHHTRPSETLNIMRDFLREHEGLSYRSYIMGFLCHYALDSTAHPYINARAEQWAGKRPPHNSASMHAEIESALDAIVLRNRTGKLPGEVPLGTMFPIDPQTNRIIAEIYEPVLEKLFGLTDTKERMIEAQKDTHFVFSLLTDGTGLKRKFISLFERGRPPMVSSHFVPVTENEDLDYGNFTHEPYTCEDGTTASSDFLELMDEAKEKAVRFIQCFDTADLAELTSDISF